MTRIQVVYATETGTAQALAEKLFAQLNSQIRENGDFLANTHGRLEICSVANLNDSWIEDASADEGDSLSIVAFIVATTGEGEVPNSMKKLWSKLLRATLPKDLLTESARVAVFGLGDSSYEKFNAAARKFRARLLQLGANEFIPTGAGDEQLDIELSFDKWTETLIGTLKSRNPGAFLTPTEIAENASKPEPCRFRVTESLSTDDILLDSREGIDLCCVSNKRMTSLDWNQDVRHIEFETSENELYQAGDVLNIWPKNDPKLVQEFLRLKYPEINPLKRMRCDPCPSHVPASFTPQQLLEELIDMNGTPTRYFFHQAAFFCSNAEERDKMVEMASSDAENAASYITYCKRERRTYFEVLQDFVSCQLPFEYLVKLVPPLRPRAFSISSSPAAHGSRLHITVALLQYLTPWKRQKIGTCSAFLQTLPQDIIVRGYITEGTLRLPKNPQAPLVLIGTGTGCAPMRSLMYERSHGRANDPKGIQFYFGCRRADADYLYESEWPSICDTVHVAFSKQEGKRVPVLLARDEKMLFNLVVEQGGYLYISGSAKRMPADIRETIVQIFGRQGEMSRDEAVKFIKHMEKERRYVVEAWS